MINDFENFGLYNNIKGTIINITHENNQFKFYIELENNIIFNCVIIYYTVRTRFGKENINGYLA